MFNRMITDDIKEMLLPYIKVGDLAADLTMGNGHDTLFLASAVGETGKVIAFDIQVEALEQTKILLDDNKVSNVTLNLAGHERVLEFIDGLLSLAMMNLGYLPGADKTLVTKESTTIRAIEDTLGLLKTEGVMAIAAYVGHEGSFEEVDALEKYLQELKPKFYAVRKISYVNRGNNPPIIYMIQKKK